MGLWSHVFCFIQVYRYSASGPNAPRGPKSVATAADLAVIDGTGTEQPTGILQTGSIGTFTGTSLDAVALLNAQVDVAAANALTPSCGYVTTPAVASLLMARQRFSASGEALSAVIATRNSSVVLSRGPSSMGPSKL